jgi:hypothetical protein
MYSQKEIVLLYKSASLPYQGIYLLLKMNFREYDLNNTKTKFAEDYFMAELTFDEIRKNLWEIIDNKKTKARDKIQALKQLADITVELLEFTLF